MLTCLSLLNDELFNLYVFKKFTFCLHFTVIMLSLALSMVERMLSFSQHHHIIIIIIITPALMQDNICL